MIILKTQQLVNIKIDYFLPDYDHILNEYFWQTNDIWPEIPRVHKFLNFWKENIEAVINSVLVQNPIIHNWRSIDDFKEIQ